MSHPFDRLVRITSPTAVSSGDAVALRATTTGSLAVASEQSGVWDVRGYSYAATSGGCWPSQVISAASTNGTNIRSAPAQVYTLTAANLNAADRWLKLYELSGAPTVGSDTPVQTYQLKGGAVPITLVFTPGMQFNNGIALALTTGQGPTDTGAVAAGEIIVSICSR